MVNIDGWCYYAEMKSKKRVVNKYFDPFYEGAVERMVMSCRLKLSEEQIEKIKHIAVKSYLNQASMQVVPMVCFILNDEYDTYISMKVNNLTDDEGVSLLKMLYQNAASVELSPVNDDEYCGF